MWDFTRWHIAAQNTHGSDYGYHQVAPLAITLKKVLKLLYNAFQHMCAEWKAVSHVIRIHNRRRCERSLTSFLVPMATDKSRGLTVFYGDHQRVFNPSDWHKLLDDTEWNMLGVNFRQKQLKNCTTEFCREAIKVVI